MAEHNSLGKWGEDLVEEYLERKGYYIQERDWHFQHRDIDIIALAPDERTWVFVEVKTRRWDDLMDPTDAVDEKKMRNIGSCANAYIKEKNIDDEVRFDIVTVVGDQSHEPQITHYEDAFNPCLL